jgi:lipid A 4'-phosphatase
MDQVPHDNKRLASYAPPFAKRFWPPLMSRSALWLFSLGLLLPAAFLSFPEADIRVSAFFFDPAAGIFTYRSHPAAEALHEATRVCVAGVAAFVLFALGARMTKAPRLKGLRRLFHAPGLLFIALVWIVGPGLIVNSLLKEHWGRARPHQVLFFGGDKRFTPPFLPAGECERNCSFSSGDPTAGAAFVAFAAVDRKRRKFWIALSVILGAAFGTARLVQGKHFLSDVLTSLYIVYVTYFMMLVLARRRFPCYFQKGE